MPTKPALPLWLVLTLAACGRVSIDLADGAIDARPADSSDAPPPIDTLADGDGTNSGGDALDSTTDAASDPTISDATIDSTPSADADADGPVVEPCVPRAETCNGIDDNCAGGVDEGTTCPAGCVGHVIRAHAYITCTNEATWIGAESTCERAGMTLAVIDDGRENDDVRALVTWPLAYWIGGSDRYVAEQWQYPDGRTFWRGLVGGRPDSARFTNWAVGHPAASGCVHVDVSVAIGGQWLDRACNETYAFVCEAPDPTIEVCDGLDNDGNSMTDEGVCPPGCRGMIDPRTFRRYAVCDGVDATSAWPVARSNCELYDMRLAIIDGNAEWLFVASMMRTTSASYWLGASDATTEGRWTWIDGTHFWTGDGAGSAAAGAFTRWNVTEPDDGHPALDYIASSPTGWYTSDAFVGRQYVCEQLP